MTSNEKDDLPAPTRMEIVYSGTVIDKFIIDRAALGLEPESIRDEYCALFQYSPTTLTLEFIKGKIKEHEQAIQTREKMFIEMFSSSNFMTRLENLQREVNEVKTQALEKRDLRTYALLTGQLIKALELFMKSVDHFKEAEQKHLTLIQQNNYFVFEDLQKHGLIDIKNESELKRIFGGKVEPDESIQDG